MRVLLIFIYLFQNDPIADLKTQFITANDTTKVLLLSDLCYQYRFINQDSAIHFGEQGIALAKKINFNRGLALCLSDLGVVYLDQSNFKKARELWTQSLTIREKTNDLQGVGSIYMKIGVIEFQTGNLDSAAQNFLSALVIFEKINDPEGIPSALNNVAASYQHQNRLDKALEYFTRSYEFAASKNKIQDVGVAGLNIANIYYLQNDLDKAIPGVKHAIGRLEGNVNATGFLPLRHGPWPGYESRSATSS